MRRLLTPLRATIVSAVLLFAGLLIDLTSDQALVVAIIYNVPIALTGVVLSRTATITFVGLALLANLTAAFDNARTIGAFDQITVTNRLLAALTFLLVGMLTLAFEHAGEEIEELSEARDLLQRERDIRHLISTVSGPMNMDVMLQTAAKGLRELLEAEAVVIVALDGERFDEPRYAAPSYSSLAAAGTLADWAVDALPVVSTPVITVRDEAGISSVGRWRSSRSADLIVVVGRPARDKASELLGEALSSLEPLRERAAEDRVPTDGHVAPAPSSD